MVACFFFSVAKGVVYVDSDPEEDDDLDVPDSTCGDHGILVESDPQNTTFQIVNTRIHDENKHVVRIILIYCCSLFVLFFFCGKVNEEKYFIKT